MSKEKYEAPQLFVEYITGADIIAASDPLADPKNGNAGNNQNCWGCNNAAGEVIGENACAIIQGTPAYEMFC